MAENDKIQMFGKSYNAIGDNQANLCLCTNGDVKIKTPNRYVTIFKNGKLNVDDFTEIFHVDSIDEIDKDGIYLVTTTDDDSNEVQAVYLNVDDNRILLTTSAEQYLSYSVSQELTPDQISLALTNVGLYFDTLDTAKASGIQNGIVYILSENEPYKVVNGEFILLFPVEDDSEPEEETYDQLQIGGIFIDGINQRINADSELTLQIDGINYIICRNHKIYIKEDIILDDDITIKTNSAQKGESGFLIYEEDGYVYLETDYLIVHNADTDYTPSLYTAYVGCDIKNLILSATQNTDETLALTLKYAENFEVGDYVLVQIGSGNAATFNYESNEDDDSTTASSWTISVTFDHAPSVTTTISVSYILSNDEDSISGDEGVIVKQTLIVVDPDVIYDDDDNNDDDNDDDEEPEKNRYGSVVISAEDMEGYIYITGIESISIQSGDSDIYYSKDSDTNSGKTIPVPYIGQVVSINPTTISIPCSSNNIINDIVYSPIYKIGNASDTEYILYQSNNSLSLQETSVVDNNLQQITTTQIGDLSKILIPGTEDYFNGYGIYSENLIAFWPIFYGAIFESVNLEDYPMYGDTLDMPQDNYDDEKYNKDIPNIEWVKALINDSYTPYYYYHEGGTDQHESTDRAYATVTYSNIATSWYLRATDNFSGRLISDYNYSHYYEKPASYFMIYSSDVANTDQYVTEVIVVPDAIIATLNTKNADSELYKEVILSSTGFWYNNDHILTANNVLVQNNDTTGILNITKSISDDSTAVTIIEDLNPTALKKWLDDNGYDDSGETKVTKVSAQSNDTTGILSLEASPEIGEVMVTGNLSTSALKTWLDDNGYSGGETGETVDSIVANNTDTTGILTLSISPTTGDVVVTGGIDEDKLDEWILSKGYKKTGIVDANLILTDDYIIDSSVELVTGVVRTKNLALDINGTMDAGHELKVLLHADTDTTITLPSDITPIDDITKGNATIGSYIQMKFISDGISIFSKCNLTIYTGGRLATLHFVSFADDENIPWAYEESFYLQAFWYDASTGTQVGSTTSTQIKSPSSTQTQNTYLEWGTMDLSSYDILNFVNLANKYWFSTRISGVWPMEKDTTTQWQIDFNMYLGGVNSGTFVDDGSSSASMRDIDTITPDEPGECFWPIMKCPSNLENNWINAVESTDNNVDIYVVMKIFSI